MGINFRDVIAPQIYSSFLIIAPQIYSSTHKFLISLYKIGRTRGPLSKQWININSYDKLVDVLSQLLKIMLALRPNLQGLYRIEKRYRDPLN